jgi:hypothetical protein
MTYTLTYRTSVGALTLPAQDADEALQRAHALAEEGFIAVEIIDGEGRRQDAGAFERSVGGAGASRTMH